MRNGSSIDSRLHSDVQPLRIIVCSKSGRPSVRAICLCDLFVAAESKKAEIYSYGMCKDHLSRTGGVLALL